MSTRGLQELQSPCSKRLESVKSSLRRFLPAGIVESVVRRAVYYTQVDPLRMTSSEFEMVVVKTVLDLRRILEPQVLSSLMMDMTELLASASEDGELEVANVPPGSAARPVARQY